MQKIIDVLEGALKTGVVNTDDKKYITLAIDTLKRIEAKGIEKVLLDTCEKELNESIGFMLTENDARIFSKDIYSYLTQPKGER